MIRVRSNDSGMYVPGLTTDDNRLDQSYEPYRRLATAVLATAVRDGDWSFLVEDRKTFFLPISDSDVSTPSTRQSTLPESAPILTPRCYGLLDRRVVLLLVGPMVKPLHYQVKDES